MPTENDARIRIHHDLLALGVRPGGVLMVHASLRALGPVEGGAATVLDALLDTVGPDGTLLMPALTYATVNASSPAFHAADTPACVGALAEFFRTRPGTLRSVHPTHSVCAVGPRAEPMLAAHENDATPCGPGSPFRLLADSGGQLLFLGCGTRPNTMMHAVEELVAPPYLYGRLVTHPCVRADGSHHLMTVRSHGFAGVAQRYDRLEALLAFPDLRIGPVLQARTHLMEARAAWTAALAALREDPLAFVEPA